MIPFRSRFRLARRAGLALRLRRDQPDRASNPRRRRHPARAVREMVRAARLGAARPPARAAGEGAGRPLGAADRADRRRQDAGRLPARAGRPLRSGRSAGRAQAHRGIHTLYISPLKALAVDIERNLAKPVAEMGLPRHDRDPHRRHAGAQAPAPEARAARHPADHARAAGAADLAIGDARALLRGSALRRARRAAFAGHLQARPSAVARPGAAADAGARPADDRPVGDRGRAGRAAALAGRRRTPPGAMADLITVTGGAKPDISILEFARARALGRATRRAMRSPRSTRRSRRTGRRCSSSTRAARPSCCSRNSGASTRTSLPIALHHGSLDVGQRRTRRDGDGRRTALRAIVATSTLDLGIDWGDVDLVVHVGAPKGASRLAQRIGRSNHRMDEPSQGDPGAGQPLRGAGVPGGARRQLSRRAGHAAAGRRRARRAGAACARHGLRASRSMPDELYDEVRAAAPYAELDRDDLRPRRRFRRHRRLCAEEPTSATPRSARPRTGSGASPIRASPSNTG